MSLTLLCFRICSDDKKANLNLSSFCKIVFNAVLPYIGILCKFCNFLAWKHSQGCSWETEKILRLSCRYSQKMVIHKKTKGTEKTIKQTNKGKSSAIMMSYFFHIWLLILLFQMLRTVPPGVSIKLATVPTILDTVCWNSHNDLPRLLLMAVFNAILTARMSQFNDWPLN